MPAIAKWFMPSAELNTAYLDQHSDTLVTLELTRPAPTVAEPATFDRFQAPLALLLTYMAAPEPPSARMYLAQHSLADLPAPLQADLPTPALVATLGRGDVYASSLWMGRPPTCTPLHRDPNPNLFVQLAGTKTVRLLRPDLGRAVYERARAQTQAQVGRGGRANMRGEEMMVGGEMEALEDAIWGHGDAGMAVQGVEAQLDPGDGLYIPLSWWHAVRGTGVGANASVGRSHLPDCKTNHMLTRNDRQIGGSDEASNGKASRCVAHTRLSLPAGGHDRTAPKPPVRRHAPFSHHPKHAPRLPSPSPSRPRPTCTTPPPACATSACAEQIRHACSTASPLQID